MYKERRDKILKQPIQVQQVGDDEFQNFSKNKEQDLRQELVDVNLPDSQTPLVAKKVGKEHYYKREAISKVAVDRYNVGGANYKNSSNKEKEEENAGGIARYKNATEISEERAKEQKKEESTRTSIHQSGTVALNQVSKQRKKKVKVFLCFICVSFSFFFFPQQKA